MIPKHEIIACDRCGNSIECRANNYTHCPCTEIVLSPNETQYISEIHEGCLCVNCLAAMQREYRETVHDFPG